MHAPCVIQKHNGQTALLINKGSKYSWFIPMDSAGLTVVKQPHKQVLDEWKALDYDVHKAVVRFHNTAFNKTDLVEAILEKLLEKEYSSFGALD